MADDRGQVSWLGALRRTFPEPRKRSSGISDASAPVHSGGTAPASHRTSLDHRSMNRPSIPPPPNESPTPRYNRRPTSRHRLGDYDAALSRRKPGFESPWRYLCGMHAAEGVRQAKREGRITKA
jgi:hypothetical protein